MSGDGMENDRIPVVAVVGPTASGKTRLAVELALRLGGEVISADSMQIYEGMDIGTAKPTAEEMRGVPHHLIGFLPPDREFSVADYVTAAKKCIYDVTGRGKLPIIAGGTGFYVDSLLQNIKFAEIKSDAGVRAELDAMLRTKGPEALHSELEKVDPELAGKLHPNNTGRVIRAIEVFRLTGVPMSEHQRRSKDEPPPFDVYWVGLAFRDRAKLYERIDGRVDAMLEQGLLEEAKQLRCEGFSKTASQAIGYKELFDCLDGKQSFDEAVERLKQNTRRYAKRQLTWFRRNVNINWVYMDDIRGYNDTVVEAVLDRMREKFFRDMEERNE